MRFFVYFYAEALEMFCLLSGRRIQRRYSLSETTLQQGNFRGMVHRYIYALHTGYLGYIYALHTGYLGYICTEYRISRILTAEYNLYNMYRKW